jgi:hypothetical protein
MFAALMIGHHLNARRAPRAFADRAVESLDREIVEAAAHRGIGQCLHDRPVSLAVIAKALNLDFGAKFHHLSRGHAEEGCGAFGVVLQKCEESLPTTRREAR